MKLTGKLKKEFKKWVTENHVNLHQHKFDCGDYVSLLSSLPLSMQFALLCDFLEEKGVIVELSYGLAFRVWYPIVGDKFLTRSQTKTEAIEKAIESLNENY